jgi:hypothetical protein
MRLLFVLLKTISLVRNNIEVNARNRIFRASTYPSVCSISLVQHLVQNSAFLGILIEIGNTLAGCHQVAVAAEDRNSFLFWKF